MKVIAKTIGNIELLDSTKGELLPWDRPAVLTWTNFWESRTGKGQVEILVSNLPEAATDEDFLGFLKDAEDEDLAIASFVSQFEEADPEPATKPKSNKKTRSDTPPVEE